jgi:hypothetical protein
MPSTISPSIHKATEVATKGIWWAKLVVPSSGSMIQVGRSSLVSPAVSSANKAQPGSIPESLTVRAFSTARSVAVTRSMRPLRRISLGNRKCSRMISPAVSTADLA